MKSLVKLTGVFGFAVLLSGVLSVRAQDVSTELSSDPVNCFHESGTNGMTAAVLCNRAASPHVTDCFEAATSANVPGTLAAVLCSGASSRAPLKCYGAATAAIDTREKHAGALAAFLCTRAPAANPLAPLDCHKISRLPFSVTAILCSAATSAHGPLACFEKFRGAGTVAAVLCSENPEAKYFDLSKFGGR